MVKSSVECEVDYVISIEKVSKRYGRKKSLNKVSLHVKKGEVLGLLGPNGAGKSTLLSILATLTKPSGGEVVINGQRLKKAKKHIRSQIGYVPQDIALWEELTVKENMRLWSKMTGRSVSDDELKTLCKSVQLEGKWSEKVQNLSGGMKRKLNIAVALIHKPAILLMDEPTVGIDLQSKMEIGRYIQKLTREGKTVIYITHDLNEILGLCHRFAVLKEGEVQFIGTMEEARTATRQHSDEAVIYQLLHPAVQRGY
ncbi:ABC transporter ATP-binding protein [Priestia veravalensis]|uniref:ABC transporter ATP-binding protein n=1 Tax=Priestia veravalensis TaxID=1414648 RepID=A0A0V8JM69_9BACI|nr:ABC transporter ATP-binding protein [Priestia veravalensis]